MAPFPSQFLFNRVTACEDVNVSVYVYGSDGLRGGGLGRLRLIEKSPRGERFRAITTAAVVVRRRGRGGRKCLS